MNCGKCQEKARVVETRASPLGGQRRRYECTAGHRFTTMEIEYELLDRLVQRSRHLEDIERVVAGGIPKPPFAR